MKIDLSEKFITGVEMTISPQKSKKLVGIFLLGSMHVNLPPKKNGHMCT